MVVLTDCIDKCDSVNNIADAAVCFMSLSFLSIGGSTHVVVVGTIRLVRVLGYDSNSREESYR